MTEHDTPNPSPAGSGEAPTRSAAARDSATRSFPGAALDIAALGHAYCDTTEPVTAILDRFQLTAAKLRDIRRAHGWPPRANPVTAGRARAVAAPSADIAATAQTDTDPSPSATPDAPSNETDLAPEPDPAPARAPDTPATAKPRLSRRKPQNGLSPAETGRIEKFYAAIDGDIDSLLSLIRAADLTPADAERLVRSLASLLLCCNRVTELELVYRQSRSSRPHRSTAANSGNADPAAATNSGSADAERVRREIAERLERFLAQRLSARTPGEPAA